MIASPEMETSSGARGVPAERVSLDNLPKGRVVIFQRNLIKKDLSGTPEAPSGLF